MRIKALAAAFLLAVSNFAAAAPLDLNQVSADAKWVVLIDVDAIRDAAGWRETHEKFWAESEATIGTPLKVFGLNLKTGLHGVTIYVTQVAGEKHPEDFRGAAIVSVDCEQKKLAENLKLLPGYKLIEHGTRQIHVCEMSVEGARVKALYIAFHSPTTVVLTTAIDDAKKAVDVLDGKAPNIAQTDSALAAAIPVGSLLLVRGMELEKVAGQFESPLLRQSESLSIAVGEKAGQSFAEGQARMKSAETAEQVEALVNGLRALIKLQAGDDDKAAKMLSLVQCVRKNKVVTISLKAPSADLQAALAGNGTFGGVQVQSKSDVKIDTTIPVKVDPKPGLDVKFGVKVGTQPPAKEPAKQLNIDLKPGVGFKFGVQIGTEPPAKEPAKTSKQDDK